MFLFHSSIYSVISTAFVYRTTRKLLSMRTIMNVRKRNQPKATTKAILKWMQRMSSTNSFESITSEREHAMIRTRTEREELAKRYTTNWCEFTYRHIYTHREDEAVSECLRRGIRERKTNLERNRDRSAISRMMLSFQATTTATTSQITKIESLFVFAWITFVRTKHWVECSRS